MTVTGGCHCGAIRYVATGEPGHNALCHCRDCTRAAGAQVVGYALFPQAAVTITGTPARYASSAEAERHFCATCGTSLFYVNEAYFPGQIDLHTATLDDPDALAPTMRIQLADAPRWLAAMPDLPGYERFPPME